MTGTNDYLLSADKKIVHMDKPKYHLILRKGFACVNCGHVQHTTGFLVCPQCGMHQKGRASMRKGYYCSNCPYTGLKPWEFCPKCGVHHSCRSDPNIYGNCRPFRTYTMADQAKILNKKECIR